MNLFVFVFLFQLHALQQIPFSCLDSLNSQAWPKDCFIFLQRGLQRDKAEFLDLKKQLNKWCKKKSKYLLKPDQYEFIIRSVFPPKCQDLVSQSEVFHKMRRKELNSFP